jgi:hypothetical protein
LSLLVILPGITIPNGTDEMGFGFHFGRRELYDFEARAKPDDVAIKPGETYVFSLSEAKVQDWERFMQREHKPTAKKLILHFQLLSFGDGTGFWGNEGMAVPHPPNTKAGSGSCKPKPNLGDTGFLESQHAPRRNPPLRFKSDELPVESLLANFLSLDSRVLPKLKPDPQSGLWRSGVGPGTCSWFRLCEINARERGMSACP